ncbi:serine/arginine repetitive matrix protein 1-like [Numida meleagris]|uniref:serine/arginine repetitive matrix protein 1-like n=1 Tax=Numida meleagris TaxID=8996 RepID=UPI000B3E29A0|nr:serine/arginine repetitive matrix protein 1-like [Numida meleagris]
MCGVEARRHGDKMSIWWKGTGDKSNVFKLTEAEPHLSSLYVSTASPSALLHGRETTRAVRRWEGERWEPPVCTVLREGCDRRFPGAALREGPAGLPGSRRAFRCEAAPGGAGSRRSPAASSRTKRHGQRAPSPRQVRERGEAQGTETKLRRPPAHPPDPAGRRPRPALTATAHPAAARHCRPVPAPRRRRREPPPAPRSTAQRSPAAGAAPGGARPWVPPRAEWFAPRRLGSRQRGRRREAGIGGWGWEEAIGRKERKRR